MAEAAKERHRNPSYRLALSTIQEFELETDKMESLKIPEAIDLESFAKMTLANQMEKMISTINMLCSNMSVTYDAIMADNTGIESRLLTAQTQADQAVTDTADLKWENQILKGLVQKQAKHIESLSEKVTNLTVCSMEKNVIIKGLLGDSKKEDCNKKVMEFFQTELEIDVEDSEIMVAHRKGSPIPDVDQPMLVQCQLPLKNRIFANVKYLAEKVNGHGDKYYVNKQLPEEVIEQSKELRQTIRDQKEKDKGLPPKDRSKIEVKNKAVYIDWKKVEKQLLPPQPMELFADRAEREKRDKIKFAASHTKSLQGSEFMAFAFKTGQINEVKHAYQKLHTLHPSADHISVAYFLKCAQGYQDDGEHGAGSRLLKGLRDAQERPSNTVVFMVRYKNGFNLGLTRFELIDQVAAQAVSRLK